MAIFTQTIYWVKNLSILALVVALALPSTHANSASAPGPQVKFNRPSVLPDGLTIKSIGENLIPLIMQSTQFRLLARGISYHEEPYSSFGFSAGPDIIPTERVILFSADESSYIVTEIETPSNHVQSMYLVNASQSHFRFSGVRSDGYTGYRVLYCTGTFFGWCTSTGTAVTAYGWLNVPSQQNYPSGANSACCVFGQWTGTSNDQNSQSSLVQGGVAWSGFNLAQLPAALPNGYVLWTEWVPGHDPVYLTPPSWMNGVQGQTLELFNEPYDYCNYPNLWYAQVWEIGPNASTQFIKCNTVVQQYAWYVFEAPISPSCVNGGWGSYCQIPGFPTVGYDMHICQNGAQGCRNINSNANPIQGYYIQHNQVDTLNDDIPGGGSYWTIRYASSV